MYSVVFDCQRGIRITEPPLYKEVNVFRVSQASGRLHARTSLVTYTADACRTRDRCCARTNAVSSSSAGPGPRESGSEAR